MKTVYAVCGGFALASAIWSVGIWPGWYIALCLLSAGLNGLLFYIEHRRDEMRRRLEKKLRFYR